MSTLGDRTWTEVAALDSVVAVPVGSVEQHGPHLPLDTDTRIAVAVASQIPGGVVAPPIAYGASGEHEGFAGTISIGHDALTTVLVEYGRSACRWAERVVFVNGHGGNAHAVRESVTLLRYEGRDATWFPCSVPGADAHAGRTETSILLYLAPEVVRTDALAPGVMDPIADLMPRLREGGMRAVTSSGVLGDPTSSTADEGRALMRDLVARFGECVRTWAPGDDGRLRSRQ